MKIKSIMARMFAPQDVESLCLLHKKISTASSEIREQDSSPFFFEENFQKELNACEVVSFDIFDTALSRTCLRPDHVFLILKDLEPFRSLPFSREQIYIRRIRAEQSAREKLWKEFHSVEASLSEIYQEFCLDLKDSSIQAFVEAEKQIEITLARKNSHIHKLWKQAKDAGKDILFISDTFFDRAFLHQLLSLCGYETQPEKIFSSSDNREGKYSGELFKIACKSSNHSASKLLHIGDNKKSDLEGARLVHAKSLLHPFACNYKPQAGSYENQKQESLIYGLAFAQNSQQMEDDWFRFGYQTFGPLFTSFTLWLKEQFKKNNTQKAFFMLRDGLILSRVYEIFASKDSSMPPFQLLHSSRRAYGVAALGCSNTMDTEFLIVSANPRPAKEFLTRLNLDAEKLAHVFQEAGFSSPDEIVDHRDKPDKVLALLRHPLVLASLNQRALVERKLLVRYLEQNNFFQHEKIALIDLGWNGTVQKSLLTILNHEKPHQNITGYYLATFPRAQDPELENYHYQSYLCHCGDPFFTANTIASCRELFEIVCSSFEGGLRHFTKSEGSIQPVLDELEISSEQQKIIEAIHEGILAYTKAFLDHKLHLADSIPAPELASALVCRIIEKPTTEEAQKIGHLEFGDGLGSATKKHLASFSTHENEMDFQNLMMDYQNAYWKQGLLAQDTPHAWALANICKHL